MITLKDALHENIHNSGVPMKRLADDLGISYQYLANAGNPSLEDFHFPLRLLIPLVKATGSFAALDYIEQACGRVAVDLPSDCGWPAKIPSELLQIMRGLGSLTGKVEDAAADGKITPRERKGIEPLITELEQHLERLRQAVKQGSVAP